MQEMFHTSEASLLSNVLGTVRDRGNYPRLVQTIAGNFGTLQLLASTVLEDEARIGFDRIGTDNLITAAPDAVVNLLNLCSRYPIEANTHTLRPIISAATRNLETRSTLLSHISRNGNHSPLVAEMLQATFSDENLSQDQQAHQLYQIVDSGVPILPALSLLPIEQAQQICTRVSEANGIYGGRILTRALRRDLATLGEYRAKGLQFVLDTFSEPTATVGTRAIAARLAADVLVPGELHDQLRLTLSVDNDSRVYDALQLSLVNAMVASGRPEVINNGLVPALQGNLELISRPEVICAVLPLARGNNAANERVRNIVLPVINRMIDELTDEAKLSERDSELLQFTERCLENGIVTRPILTSLEYLIISNPTLAHKLEKITVNAVVASKDDDIQRLGVELMSRLLVSDHLNNCQHQPYPSQEFLIAHGGVEGLATVLTTGRLLSPTVREMVAGKASLLESNALEPIASAYRQRIITTRDDSSRGGEFFKPERLVEDLVDLTRMYGDKNTSAVAVLLRDEILASTSLTTETKLATARRLNEAAIDSREIHEVNEAFLGTLAISSLLANPGNLEVATVNSLVFNLFHTPNRTNIAFSSYLEQFTRLKNEGALLTNPQAAIDVAAWSFLLTAVAIRDGKIPEHKRAETLKILRESRAHIPQDNQYWKTISVDLIALAA
ncbi:MAG: hypothetical protein WCP97_08145 [bacterium]